MKKLLILMLSCLLIFSGCSQTKNTTSSTTTTTSSTGVLDTSDMFTDRDCDESYDESDCIKISLNNDNSSSSDKSVTIDGQTITISEEGTYLISGTLSNGSIIVDTDAKVQLVFDNVTITNQKGAAIYIKQADKVFITLAKDSKNTLTSSAFDTSSDNNIDGAIFSKDDLTINGEGTLNVESAAHGIVCKDDLVITNGTYNITSEKQGLSGKQSVRIKNGTVTITSQTDGIHSEDSDDETLGYVYIQNGTFTIKAQGDGISSSNVVEIENGTYQITCGNGSSQKVNDETSQKGIKAEKTVDIENGTFTIDTSDDSLHSNGDVMIKAGTLTLNSGDDGIHADEQVIIEDGKINIQQSYEGIEGKSVVINGGTIQVTSSDDGLNAADGSVNNEGGPGGGNANVDDSVYIEINGGTITINATGDGIDSNGNLKMTGGTVYVSGPSNDGNGALDYDGTATITGGSIIAIGMSGMAQNFGNDSTQGSLLVNLTSTQEGEVVLKDSDGNVLMSYTPARSYNSIVVSCSDLKKGETYTLVTGLQTTTVTLSSLVSTYGSTQGGMNNGGPRK